MESSAEVAVNRRERHIERLYRTHVPAAGRLAYLLTGDVDVAEDIAHEAFVRVAGRAAGLRSPDAFASYLGTTVVNLCRSHWRRRRKERNKRETERTSVVHVKS
jgi:DNA-directed RNA polymerase specialized sigma24 family protein